MAVWDPRANEIFAQALALPASQRAAYLERAWGGDGELRLQVEALLAARAGEPTPPPDSGSLRPTGADVVRALGASRPRVQLREPEGQTVTDAGTEAAAAGPAEFPCRYRLAGEIARGGMGAILKGRDTELGRDIALKVLLEKHQGRTELAHRFVEEAQIAGQLQHPGIVPVYDLEAEAGKRPYFTMKLVKGQTLAQLLKQRSQPGAELPRFVAVFEQVCQTLAYAHARGVIHRDLKPANVMVGAFGEVQVMDWGLAKVLPEGGVADEEQGAERERRDTVSLIRTQRSQGAATQEDAGGHTQEGDVLGTPAYMAPEQARGDVDLVDERADVFGLGAILCEILTGQPPFTGKTAEAHRKAQTAQLDDAYARLDGCGTDAELVSLARRCLASEPWHRPRHAGEVAAAVTAYQHAVAQRLHQAELDRAQALVKAAEERKRRKLAVGLAAAVLALVVVGSGGGLWLQRQQAERRAEQARQQAERRQAVTSALEKAAELQKEARWAEAQAVLEQAQQRLATADEAEFGGRVRQALADLKLVGELDTIRLEASTIVDGRFDFAGADRKYAEAFRAAGLGGPGDPVEAVATRIGASGVREALVGALDDWAARSPERTRAEWALAVAALADPEGGRARFRAPEARGHRAALEDLARATQKERLSPQLLFALAVTLERSGGDPVPLLRSAQERYPADFWLNFQLGTVLNEAKPEGALGYLRAALALRPNCHAVYNNLGNALANKGQVEEAIACYHQALALDPKFALAHNNLGLALAGKGQVEEAIACYEKALALDPNLAMAHNNLGTALADKGQVEEAVACLRKALALAPKFANAHYNLGNALKGKGQVEEAITCYQKALALDPKFANAHTNLGVALAGKGQVEEAIACFQRAIALDPKEAGAHTNLGAILCDVQRDYDGAIACFHKALALDPKDAQAHTNLGNALRGKGQVEEAIAWFHKAIVLDPKFARAHGALGWALLQQGRFTEAEASTRRALDLLPPGHPQRPFASQQLQQCQRYQALEKKLPAVLADQLPASAAERLDYAQLCALTGRHHASARLYTEAFHADTQLADNLQAGHRYNAARAAAQAGSGKGADAGQLDDREHSRLRRQALDWLRADLAAWARQAASDKESDRARVGQTLAHWQRDPDVAGVRDQEALAKLPEPERADWQKLWADVEALLQKAAPPMK
jgi:serine/threonine-protein kinase